MHEPPLRLSASALRSPSARLESRIAAITGAGSGIGAATAFRFAAEGAKVAVLARGDRGRQVVAAIEENGCEAAFILCDVDDASNVERAMDEVVQRYSRIDILVNNAARNRVNAPTERVDSLELDDWEATLRTNLTGAFLCSQHALRHMLAAGGGTILNVVSSAGAVGMRNLAAYAASKAGLISLTKCMALDYAAHGIRVNAIMPTVETDRLATVYDHDETRLAEVRRSIPFGRLGTPEEAAAALAFLASDDSSFSSGVVLAVDGALAAAR
jgi:NAD(P)-dependent dehydrogenase (short-subunit alcohol dehydrogenase family)